MSAAHFGDSTRRMWMLSSVLVGSVLCACDGREATRRPSDPGAPVERSDPALETTSAPAWALLANPDLDVCRDSFSWKPEAQYTTLVDKPDAWDYRAEALFDAARAPFVAQDVLPRKLEEGLSERLMATSTAGLVNKDGTGYEVWILSIAEGCQLFWVTWYPTQRAVPFMAGGNDFVVSWRNLPGNCPEHGVWVDVAGAPLRQHAFVDQQGVRAALRRQSLCVRRNGEEVSAALVVYRGWFDDVNRLEYGLVDRATGLDLVELSKAAGD